MFDGKRTMESHPGRVDIAASARKHGVTDEDMRHALKHYWAVHSTDDPSVAIYIGPSMSVQPLEIVMVQDSEGAVIIHAMPARRKFLQ